MWTGCGSHSHFSYKNEPWLVVREGQGCLPLGQWQNAVVPRANHEQMLGLMSVVRPTMARQTTETMSEHITQSNSQKRHSQSWWDWQIIRAVYQHFIYRVTEHWDWLTDVISCTGSSLILYVWLRKEKQNTAFYKGTLLDMAAQCTTYAPIAQSDEWWTSTWLRHKSISP